MKPIVTAALMALTTTAASEAKDHRASSFVHHHSTNGVHMETWFHIDAVFG